MNSAAATRPVADETPLRSGYTVRALIGLHAAIPLLLAARLVPPAAPALDRAFYRVVRWIETAR